MTRALSDAELLDWLRLARTDGVGPVTFHRLIRTYGSASVALNAAPDIAKRAGRATPMSVYAREDAEAELKALRKREARLLPSCDPDFPKLLLQIEPVPPVIAVLGDLALFEKPPIAMVGSRNASAASLRIARDLAGDLSARGYLVVSGLARGIDGAVHAASLEGGTVAVLAGGLNHVYPPEHAELYAQIAERGILVSENRLGANAIARDFPRRNRLISGLSLGVIVVEAALQSGSLITARTALEQNREVMAVPGSPLDPRSRGTNDLIKQGAILVENADDIIRAINTPRLDHPLLGLARETGGDWPDGAYEPAETGLLERLRELLSPMPTHLDELVRATGASAAEISAAVLELELAGQAVSSPGGRVALALDADRE
ncbi:MAG: DNA-processing protein DprA [Caulobacterales bacterium]